MKSIHKQIHGSDKGGRETPNPSPKPKPKPKKIFFKKLIRKPPFRQCDIIYSKDDNIFLWTQYLNDVHI